jgi:DNA primase
MRYPPQFLERLRTTARLSEVVGRRIAITKKGKEHGGLCPFHNEKSPSFTVNDDKGFYHCFGCGAHGDAISFIQNYEKISHFGEAVERLARELGVPLPELSEEGKVEAEAWQKTLNALEAAAKFFERQLMSEAGMKARNYLEKRGITQATIKQFRLGFAPETYGHLKNALLKEGFSEQDLLEAGLLARRDNGETYERFRARLMFPIRSQKGKVVAYGGRLLEPNEHAPKYLNSPETSVFKKREVMYNVDGAMPHARNTGQIVLVEGYMDVVSLVQAGFPNVVATLGTAVSTEHLQMLWRVVDAPIACLDGDAAGQRAMLRVAELAFPKLTAGKDIRFAVLPQGDDPDSLVQREGKAALEAVLARANPLHEAVFQAYAHRHNLKNPNERAALDQELMKLAGTIEDANVKSYYRDYFKQHLREVLKPAFANAPQKRGVLNTSVASPFTMLSRYVLKLVLAYPDLLQEGEVETAIERLHCDDATQEDIKHAILDALHRGEVANHPLANALLEDTRVALPTRAKEGTHEALAALRQWMHQHDVALLEQEYAALTQAANENDYEHLLIVQDQLRKLRANTQLPVEE